MATAGQKHTLISAGDDSGTYAEDIEHDDEGECPIPGLDGLFYAKAVVIRQKPIYAESLFQIEHKNVYEMYDADTNGPLFTLAEESGCCERVCCGPQRSLEIIMMEISTDGLDARTRDSVDARYATPASTTGSLKYNHCMSRQQVKPKTMVKFERPFRFGYGGCCPGYRQEMRAGLSMNGVDVPIGVVRQRLQCCGLGLAFDVMNSTGQIIYEIHGPCVVCNVCCLGSCRDYTFDITQPGLPHHSLGQITKVRSTVQDVKEVITSADNFHLIFPPDSPINDKILFTSAAIFIDFLKFEAKKGFAMCT